MNVASVAILTRKSTNYFVRVELCVKIKKIVSIVEPRLCYITVCSLDRRLVTMNLAPSELGGANFGN